MRAVRVSPRAWERAQWWRASLALLEQRASTGQPLAVRLYAAMRAVEAEDGLASLRCIAEAAGLADRYMSRTGPMRQGWTSLGLPAPPRGQACLISAFPLAPPDEEERQAAQRQRDYERAHARRAKGENHEQ